MTRLNPSKKTTLIEGFARNANINICYDILILIAKYFNSNLDIFRLQKNIWQIAWLEKYKKFATTIIHDRSTYQFKLLDNEELIGNSIKNKHY